MNAKRFETPFFIGLILLAFSLLAFIFWPYLGAMILAITLAILFHPLYLKLRSLMRNRERLAAFSTVIIAVVAILLPVSFFGFKIFQEAQELYERITAGDAGIFIEFLNVQLGKFLPWLDIDFNEYLGKLLNALAGSLGSIFSKVANITISLFLALFAFYYFLKDREKLKKAILRLSPLSGNKTEKIISKLVSMAGSVIKGSLVVAVVQGILVGLGFFLFGLSNPILWGSVSAVASLIPILGVGLIMIPGIISLILSGNIPLAIGFAIWSIFIVGLADNFLRPLLVERDVHVHPLLVFFSVLGGLAVFGATGLLLGPLALSLFLALLEIYPIIVREEEKISYPAKS